MCHTELLLKILKAEERARLTAGMGRKSKESIGWRKMLGRKKRGYLICDFKNCRILRFVCIVLYLKCPPWTHVLKVWTPSKWCILGKLSSLWAQGTAGRHRLIEVDLWESILASLLAQISASWLQRCEHTALPSPTTAAEPFQTPYCSHKELNCESNKSVIFKVLLLGDFQER